MRKDGVELRAEAHRRRVARGRRRPLLVEPALHLGVWVGGWVGGCEGSMGNIIIIERATNGFHGVGGALHEGLALGRALGG